MRSPACFDRIPVGTMEADMRGCSFPTYKAIVRAMRLTNDAP